MSEPSLPDPVVTPDTSTSTTSTTPATPATAATATRPAKAPRQLKLRDIVIAVVLVLLVIFIAENYGQTPIRFIGPKVTTYLWLALLIATAFGFVLGFTVALRRGRAAVKAAKR